MPYYCENCLGEVTIEEKEESEIMYAYHVYCRACMEKLRKKEKLDPL